jgi:hypothetical protein
MLESLVVDSGSGSTFLWLPAGDYDGEIDSGSGRLTWRLPAGGSHVFRLDSGSGSIHLEVPAATGFRLVIEDSGSGTVVVGDDRLIQVSSGDEPIWESEGFEAAADRSEVIVDMGSGSLQVEGLVDGR